MLLEAARQIRMVSRIMIPAETGAGSVDPRRLGVAVSRMLLDGRPIALDDDRLVDGWHAPERDWRWTQGDAALPCAGGNVLEIGIVPLGQYWQTDAQTAHPDRGGAEAQA